MREDEKSPIYELYQLIEEMTGRTVSLKEMATIKNWYNRWIETTVLRKMITYDQMKEGVEAMHRDAYRALGDNMFTHREDIGLKMPEPMEAEHHAGYELRYFLQIVREIPRAEPLDE